MTAAERQAFLLNSRLSYYKTLEAKIGEEALDTMMTGEATGSSGGIAIASTKEEIAQRAEETREVAYLAQVRNRQTPQLNNLWTQTTQNQPSQAPKKQSPDNGAKEFLIGLLTFLV